MTKKQMEKLGNLLADHRNCPYVANYQGSPTFMAVFKFVDSLIDQFKQKTQHNQQNGAHN